MLINVLVCVSHERRRANHLNGISAAPAMRLRVKMAKLLPSISLLSGHEHLQVGRTLSKKAVARGSASRILHSLHGRSHNGPLLNGSSHM